MAGLEAAPTMKLFEFQTVTDKLQSSNDPLVSLKRIAFDKHIASRIRFKFQNQSADNVEEVF